MKWSDIKLASLQKMFGADGNNIPSDDATRDYVCAMPQAANEAMQLLSTSNKRLRKFLDIVQTEQTDNDGYSTVHDMKTLASDFYSPGLVEVYKMSGTRMSRYVGASFSAGRYLCIGTDAGTYRVFYDAWPETITSSTADDYDLPLDPEVSVLIPLYIASQLYKDDDNSIATMYRNEFETARAELKPTPTGTLTDSFYSKTGWC